MDAPPPCRRTSPTNPPAALRRRPAAFCVRGDVLRRLAVLGRRHQVVEDPGRAHDGRLLRMGQRHLDDLDPEQRRVGVLVGVALTQPGSSLGDRTLDEPEM